MLLSGKGIQNSMVKPYSVEETGGATTVIVENITLEAWRYRTRLRCAPRRKSRKRRNSKYREIQRGHNPQKVNKEEQKWQIMISFG